MNRAFRKYHRQLAIIVFLPLLLTVITGVGYSILHEFLGLNELAEIVLKVHNGEILGLEKIYPLLNGLGLVGMLITGISMTGLFRQRPNQPN
jgi:hypothetical protein